MALPVVDSSQPPADRLRPTRDASGLDLSAPVEDEAKPQRRGGSILSERDCDLEADRRLADVETVELELLLEGIQRVYGLDFRGYVRAPLERRVRERMYAEGVSSVSALQERVLHDVGAMERLLQAFSVTSTTMFRDPEFYRMFRREVVPMLRTWPFIRIWHAGCSTGEEVYSMAVLLQEEGIYDRCRLYATDISENVLARARRGIYPLGALQEYTTNYLQAGGRGIFSDYYTAHYDAAMFSPELRRNVVFARHNLVVDGPFNEFNVILCRNVLMYFNGELRDRVYRLFHENLVMFGILGLGNNEFVESSPFRSSYRALHPPLTLYRKVWAGSAEP